MIAVMNEPRQTEHREVDRRPGSPAALEPLLAILRQLEELVEGLTDEQYTSKPSGVTASSIGGHVRHNLDHVESFLNGLLKGKIDYDARQRGTAVETSRLAALHYIKGLTNRLALVRWETVRNPLQLSALVDPNERPTVVLTSAARELTFVLSHTIHHNSLIGLIAQLLGAEVPRYFGYAPSTIAHRESLRCAR